MNDNGDFVYTASDLNGGWVAVFYDSAGTIQATINTTINSNSDQRILVTSDNEFVLGGTGFREVYSATGTWIGDSNFGGLIRLDGSDIVYSHDSSGILSNPFPVY
jgi:hypothetical protein